MNDLLLPRPTFEVTHDSLPTGGVITAIRRADKLARLVPHHGEVGDDQWITLRNLVQFYGWEGKESSDPEDYRLTRSPLPRGRPTKYPWHEWLNGDEHLITIPDDVNEASFVANMRARARRAGLIPAVDWEPDGRVRFSARASNYQPPLSAPDLLNAIVEATREADGDWEAACDLLTTRYDVRRRREADVPASA